MESICADSLISAMVTDLRTQTNNLVVNEEMEHTV